MDGLSASSIAALAAAGAILIAAFFTGIATVITAWRTVANKVSAIEGHVNSERTELVGKNITLEKENELLRGMLNDSKQTAALLAQAASHKLPVTTVLGQTGGLVLAPVEPYVGR